MKLETIADALALEQDGQRIVIDGYPCQVFLPRIAEDDDAIEIRLLSYEGEYAVARVAGSLAASMSRENLAEAFCTEMRGAVWMLRASRIDRVMRVGTWVRTRGDTPSESMVISVDKKRARVKLKDGSTHNAEDLRLQ